MLKGNVPIEVLGIDWKEKIRLFMQINSLESYLMQVKMWMLAFPQITKGIVAKTLT
jgi:hypothetical protein